MYSEKNGKLESKLNISVIQSSSKNVEEEEDKSDTLSYKCTVCILDSFELNYGPLSDECREKILTKPTAFLWKHFFDFWASFFIITPCIISFWRGTWDYAVIYLEKEAFNVRMTDLELISLTAKERKWHRERERERVSYLCVCVCL